MISESPCFSANLAIGHSVNSSFRPDPSASQIDTLHISAVPSPRQRLVVLPNNAALSSFEFHNSPLLHYSMNRLPAAISRILAIVSLYET